MLGHEVGNPLTSIVGYGQVGPRGDRGRRHRAGAALLRGGRAQRRPDRAGVRRHPDAWSRASAARCPRARSPASCGRSSRRAAAGQPPGRQPVGRVPATTCGRHGAARPPRPGGGQPAQQRRQVRRRRDPRSWPSPTARTGSRCRSSTRGRGPGGVPGAALRAVQPRRRVGPAGGRHRAGAVHHPRAGPRQRGRRRLPRRRPDGVGLHADAAPRDGRRIPPPRGRPLSRRPAPRRRPTTSSRARRTPGRGPAAATARRRGRAPGTAT